jgi:hypothetical protein
MRQTKLIDQIIARGIAARAQKAIHENAKGLKPSDDEAQKQHRIAIRHALIAMLKNAQNAESPTEEVE